MSAYSEAVAKAKADLAARGQLGPLDPGGANEFTVGGGDYESAHQEHSEIVADATLGVDGEGDQPGAPPGQMKLKTKVGGDVVTKEFSQFVKAAGVDAEHGIVFGWGIICKEDGKPYIDVQNDEITEDSMLKAAASFAEGARIGKEMHAGDTKGQHLFLFPLTTDIAKALGLETKKTGLLLGYKPPADVLEKFKDGTFTGFSIGGHIIDSEDVA